MRREGRRQRRMRQTARKARQRHHLYLSRIHPPHKRSVAYFDKRVPLGCGCRRRRASQPKIGTGCWCCELRPAVRVRIDKRNLLSMLRLGLLDPDEVFSPIGRSGRTGSIQRRSDAELPGSAGDSHEDVFPCGI